MAKKTPEQRLASIVIRLTRKHSPDVIQIALAKTYEEYDAAAPTEIEGEFWMKCSRASFNLASGMNKWAHDMIEELEEEEEGEGE